MNKKLVVGLIIFIFLFVIQDAAANSAPVFSSDTKNNFTLVEHFNFVYQLNATDPDNDSITFTDDANSKIVNWSTFNMDASGYINLTLTDADVGEHIVTINIRDEFLNSNSIAILFKILNANDPPNITSFTPSTTTPSVDEASSLQFDHTSVDLNNDTLSYSWKLDSVEKVTTKAWLYEPDYKAAGNHNITLIVSDGNETDYQHWNVTVNNVDTSPYLVSAIEDEEWNEDNNVQINFGDYFSDADGDSLSYSFTDVENIEISISGNEATLNPDKDWYGVRSVVFTAKDPAGNSVSSNNINLTVRNVADCGKDGCEAGEDCETCPGDCGECPFEAEAEEPAEEEKEEKIEEPTTPVLGGAQTTGFLGITGRAITNITKPKPLISILVIILVLVLIFLAYWFIFREKKETYGF